MAFITSTQRASGPSALSCQCLQLPCPTDLLSLPPGKPLPRASLHRLLRARSGSGRAHSRAKGPPGMSMALVACCPSLQQVLCFSLPSPSPSPMPAEDLRDPSGRPLLLPALSPGACEHLHPSVPSSFETRNFCLPHSSAPGPPHRQALYPHSPPSRPPNRCISPGSSFSN